MQFMSFVLYFVAALLALEGLATLLRKRADPARVRNRLTTLAKRISSVDLAAAAESSGSGSLLRNRDGLHLVPIVRSLELLLYRSGGTLSITRFVAISLILGGGGFLGVLALTSDPWRAVPALLPGFFPVVWVRKKASKRMRIFEEQLPDALALITRSMRSGHSLVAGFQLVGEELADPIGTEFSIVADEVRLGLEIREGLANLMRRVENPDLPYLTTAVLIQRQTGGNLAELLDKLSNLLRERGQFTGRVRAMTAQGRGAATFLACWMPFIVVVIWLMAPDYIMPLVENSWGHAVLGSAFGIDLLAYYLALRIADVEA
jgi:tight adherence protein B